MEENVSKLIGTLTQLVEQLRDTKTGDATSMDHPGIIKNAFDKSESQKKSDDNSNLASSIAEANAEHRKSEEEEKGRRIMKTVMPMSISSIDPKAVKQLKSVLGGDKSSMSGGPDVKESEGMFGWLLGLLPMLGTIGSVVMTVIGTIGTVISTVLGIIAGPIGLVILAVTALAAFFTGFWEEWEETGDFGDAMIAGVGEIFDWLIAIPATLLKDLTTWAMRKMGFEEEADFIDEHWDDFLATWKEIVLAPITILVGAFENLWDGITQIWDGVKDFFSGIGALLTGDFEKAGEKFESAFGNIINGLWDWIWALPNSAINWVMEFLGFKEPGSEPINLGDMLWDTMLAIFDWFKLLFTSPEEAFKKIGDWFDRLFDDPVAAFREIMPDWLVDFGVWIWDHTLGPIVDLWCDIVGDPEGAKEAFLNLMPDWLRDIAEWIWDRTIGPAVELWNYIFDHPDGAKAAFKSLFPEWLWDIMEWIYDHTLGPIVGIFSDLFDGKDIEATFRKYLPDWLVDTFLWVKDNVFGPITDFFGHLFDGDIESALRSILPDWLVDGLMWVVDNVFGPITDFFSTLFSGDIVGAFKKILPDWLIDFFGWIGDKIFGPIGDWFSGIWDKITDIKGYAKAELKKKSPWLYEKMFGEEDAHAEALAKQEEEARKQLLGTGIEGEDVDNMMKDMEKFHSEVMTNQGIFNDTSRVGDDTVDNQKKLKQYFDDLGEDSEHALDDATWQNMMQGISDTRFAATTLGKDLAAYVGKSTTEITMEDKAAVEKFFKEKVHADEWGSADDITDKYTDAKGNKAGGGIDELGMFMAQRHAGKLAHDAKANSLYKILAKNLSFPVKYTNEQGDEVAALIKYATNADGTLKYDKGGMELHPEQFMTPAIRDAYRALFKSNEQYGGALEAMSRHMTDLDFQKAIDWTDKLREGAEESAEAPLDDFIMRPGMKPVAFNKGDILLGIHEDNPRVTTNNSPELINRVDQMVMTLKENKDLQAKMLEAMIESGMMKKQGNTVVNNGGNSTVVNNTTTESNIMSFRDKVVGRISNSSTKYK